MVCTGYNKPNKQVCGITINGIHFTIHPTQLRDGTLVAYSSQKINFDSQSTSSSINSQTANSIPTLISSSQANTDIANVVTTPSSEWFSTKRAIDDISKEIKRLKRARKQLQKALRKEH
ncbi:hypothetical protein INT48_000149 [Thamnidium elegans]|uniref:Uncharacterized protein n=1 Tax=Thamnidium elegans TaxID=101142 RepID=A0A8H7SY63_9FUNG|nr:hypothetical protein INT48_000149 [Thamnidium elegans]